MLIKAILFLLLIYLFVGIFRHFFEMNKSPKPKEKIKPNKNQQKSIANIFEAEDVPFKEIEKKSNEK